MKSLFKFIFNVLRNIALVIVLLFFAFVFIIANDPELQKGISERIADKEEERALSISASTLPARTTYTASAMTIESKSDEEEPKNIDQLRRVKINIEGNGTKYIHPTNILRLTKDTLMLASGERMYYKNKITDLGKKLESVDGYLVTRYDIINCYYVEEVIRSRTTHPNSTRYKHHAKLADGYEFLIPERKVTNIKNILDQISL